MLEFLKEFLIDENNRWQDGVGGGMLLDKHALPSDIHYMFIVMDNLSQFIQSNCDVSKNQMISDTCKESIESECAGYMALTDIVNHRYDDLAGLVDAAMKRIVSERCDLYLSMDDGASLENPLHNHYADGGCLAAYSSHGNNTQRLLYSLPSFVKQKMRVCYDLPELVSVYLQRIDENLRMIRHIHIRHEESTNAITGRNSQPIDFFVRDRKGVSRKFHYNYKFSTTGFLTHGKPVPLASLLRALYVDGDAYNADQLMLVPAKYNSMLQQVIDLDRCASTRFFGETAVSLIHHYGGIMRAAASGIMSTNVYYKEYQNALGRLSANRHNLKVCKSMLEQNYCYRSFSLNSNASHSDSHSTCVNSLLTEIKHAENEISDINAWLSPYIEIFLYLSVFVFASFLARKARDVTSYYLPWVVGRIKGWMNGDVAPVLEDGNSVDEFFLSDPLRFQVEKKVVYDGDDTDGKDATTSLDGCVVWSADVGVAKCLQYHLVRAADEDTQTAEDVRSEGDDIFSDDFDLISSRKECDSINDGNSTITSISGYGTLGKEPSTLIKYCAVSTDGFGIGDDVERGR